MSKSETIFVENPKRKLPQKEFKIIPAHVQNGVEPVKANLEIRPNIPNLPAQDNYLPPRNLITPKKVPIIKPEPLKTEGVGINLSSMFTGAKALIQPSSSMEEEHVYTAPVFQDEFDLEMLEKAEEELSKNIFLPKKNNQTSNFNSIKINSGQFFIVINDKLIFESESQEEIEKMLENILFSEDSEYPNVKAEDIIVYKKFNFRAGIVLT